MGLFSKFFGAAEQPMQQPDDHTKQIAELTDCECQYINKPLSSEDVFAMYKKEYARGQQNGYIPVILVVSEHLIEMIECNYEDNGGAETYRSAMLEAGISYGREFLKQRFETNMETFGEESEREDIYGEYADNVRPASCFLSTGNAEKLILVKIPAAEPWKVFAWIPFGGWNECPDTEDMMAVCKYWYDEYNAVPAVISSDELQMYIQSPVNDIDEALKTAEEHYAFCNDTVDQGAETIKALASMILNSEVWYFWWD